MLGKVDLISSGEEYTLHANHCLSWSFVTFTLPNFVDLNEGNEMGIACCECRGSRNIVKVFF